MTLKKMLAMIAVAVITTGFIATTSYAATKVCFSAELTRIGTVGAVSPSSGYRIEVKGGSCGFTENFPLFIHEDLGDAGLATALTAFSLTKKLTIKVPDPVVANDLVTAVHMDL